MCFYTKQICFLEQCRKCSRKPSLLVIFLMQKYTCIFVSSEFMETLMADPAVIHKGLPKRMVGLPSDGASVADFFLNTGFFFFFNAKCFTQLKTMQTSYQQVLVAAGTPCGWLVMIHLSSSLKLFVYKVKQQWAWAGKGPFPLLPGPQSFPEPRGPSFIECLQDSDSGKLTLATMYFHFLKYYYY